MTARTSLENGNSSMYRRPFSNDACMALIPFPALNKVKGQGELCVQFRARYNSRERRKHSIGLVMATSPGLRRRFDRLSRGTVDNREKERADGAQPSALHKSYRNKFTTRLHPAPNLCQTKTFPATQAGITTEAGTVFQQPNRAGR